MRVIVDIMGGDKAPFETLKGAVEASRSLNASFILVGDRAEIERIAAEQKYDLRRFEIVDAPTVITMQDAPLSVVRAKKDSSMSVGLHLLAEGKGDAFVSTGNTGALFTGATLIVRKVRGIQRAAIGTLLPTANIPTVLLDTGANVTVTDEYLEQFAVMGSAYIRKMFGISAPSVCKEIEENNRMGKTRHLFKKIKDTKETLLAKMDSMKDRNDMDLTEAEDIKKRWQEYTEELYKKDLHDPG